MGIPSSGDSRHQGTESPLHEILVGIPFSGDSVQWGFRPVEIPGTYLKIPAIAALKGQWPFLRLLAV